MNTRLRFPSALVCAAALMAQSALAEEPRPISGAQKASPTATAPTPSRSTTSTQPTNAATAATASAPNAATAATAPAPNAATAVTDAAARRGLNPQPLPPSPDPNQQVQKKAAKGAPK
jgi:hypothetical protein